MHDFAEAKPTVPADRLADAVRWAGWMLGPGSLAAIPEVADREVWYWADPLACRALSESIAAGGGRELPAGVGKVVLHPDDLPSLDGFMVFSDGVNCLGGGFDGTLDFGDDDMVSLPMLAVRWTACSDGLLFESFTGVAWDVYAAQTRAHMAASGSLPPDVDGVCRLPPLAAGAHERLFDVGHWTGGLSALPIATGAGPLVAGCGGPTLLWEWGADGFTRLDLDEQAVALHREARTPDRIEFPDDEAIAARAGRTQDRDSAIGLGTAVVLYAAWHMASDPAEAALPRAVRRRIPKPRQAKPGSVRVIRLRVVGGDGGGAPSEHGRPAPRRHLVSGHWRRQWYPSLRTHRAKFIAPHLRGGRPGGDASRGPRTVRAVTAGDAAGQA